jgi:nucleoside-diphosphate-sugar epimerase
VERDTNPKQLHKLPANRLRPYRSLYSPQQNRELKFVLNPTHPSMSKGLVLVTGANGYIAARTVETILQAGYSVRGTLRSQASAAPLKEALKTYGDRFTTIEVPDITATGAFDEAIKGVDFVAHLAAPVSLYFTDPEPVLRTATRATEEILESAAREPSVKGFLLMSSITAIRGMREGRYIWTEQDWNDFAPAAVEKMGKQAPGPVIYSASKVAAERAFWRFRDERAPKFAMAAVNPVFVAGPPLVLPTSPEKLGETYAFVWNIFAGGELASPSPTHHWYVDVRDVGRLVVAVLEAGHKVDGERFIAKAGYAPPQAVADILRAAYPDRRSIIREGKPGEGYVKGLGEAVGDQDVDASKAVRLMGSDWIPLEKMFLDETKALEAFL